MSRLDNSFFRNHICNVHGIDDVNQDLENLKINGSQGYKVPMKCPLCFLQCFESHDMKFHFSSVHSVVENQKSLKNESAKVEESDIIE